MSDRVKPIEITEEMRQAYLSYAMSVIASRALPDARDGMKPVQRRILYAMHDMGLRPATPHRKSARIVGEVLGKYHPHGDQSVYDAMVRLAQDFSVRYPLVDGQGNFGSIDGDPPAAMRYTEARMEEVGFSMLTDLDKDTVDFGTNFDDSLKEPLVLPAYVPSLLVNGSSGIAVGLSTSIPPHNLGEVVDALSFMLDGWDNIDEITAPDLMNFIKGPDFPTGGMAFRYRDENDVLLKSYASGRGRITVRASVQIEQMERNKSRIIVTELPYQVNKTNLMTKIADLHRDGRLEGLTDLRDESDRNGMRIVLETTRTVEADKVLRRLYKLTPMETTYSIIMVALVNGEPKVLTLKQALRVYLDHRLEVTKRRSEYLLRKAKDRAHILEGLLKALDNLDEVINIIRRSRTAETARNNLMQKLKLSEIQARAILDMQLRRLAALERRKLQEEYKEVKAEITRLEKLLSRPDLMRQTIKTELHEMKAQFVDVRRTLIVDKAPSSVLTAADLIVDERVWVTVGEEGSLARTQSEDLFEIPGRPKDLPKSLLEANTRDIVYLVAANGEAVSKRVHDLSLTAQMGVGGHWTEATGFARGAYLASAVVLPGDVGDDENGGYITLATIGGTIKRIRVSDLPGVSDQPFTLMRVEDGDSLGWARWTSGTDDIFLATAMGQLIRFDEGQVRPMGLKAGGVAGIKLGNDADGVVSMETISQSRIADAKKPLLVWSITDTGLAKSTPLDEYPKKKRYGQGVVNIKMTKDVGEVVAMVIGDKRTEIYVNTQRGNTKRMRIAKAIEGRRSLKPREVLTITKPNRVTGTVRGRRAVSEKVVEAAQQLSLI